MVLMVSLSVSTSPLASMVTLRSRSPLATAVVTSAMSRTWEVRLSASMLTLSVSSCQVPLRPLTWAWPPSWPSEPTSRATRITSAEKMPSPSTMVLMTLAVRKNSPLIGPRSVSRGTACSRSPPATAVITRTISPVGWARPSMSVLTLSTPPAQEPPAPASEARWVSLPSRPTTVLMRVNSSVSRSFCSMTSLSVSAILPARPVLSMGMRAEKSPFLKAVRTLSSCCWFRVFDVGCFVGVAGFVGMFSLLRRSGDERGCREEAYAPPSHRRI